MRAGHAERGSLFLETKNVVLDENDVKPFNAKPGNYVRTSVTDTGVGMDEKTRKRIFEPFSPPRRWAGALVWVSPQSTELLPAMGVHQRLQPEGPRSNLYDLSARFGKEGRKRKENPGPAAERNRDHPAGG